MAWVPAERVALEQVAAALASGTAVQSAVPPSRKVTVPVGVPDDPETLAVNVTWLPAVLGLLEEASEIEGSTFGDDTVKAYDAIVPMRGAEWAPVASGASWPSAAKA